MSCHSIPRERGFVHTGSLVRTPDSRRPNALVGFAIEAGEMLRGAIDAPLRRAEQHATVRELDALQDDLRKDIGLDG